MNFPEGQIIMTERLGVLGVEGYDYAWNGPNRAYVRSDILEDFVDGHRYPPEIGAMVAIGPYRVRIIEYDIARRAYVVERGHPVRTWLHFHVLRSIRLLDLAYRRAVITAAVWGLATHHEYRAPSWRDVHALGWVAKRLGRGE